MTLKGVDISKYQSKINWEKVRKSNISFALIRCSCGTGTDRLFRTHIENALKNDINVGVYCYSLALSTSQAIKEADKVISLISSYNISYPVCFDMEDSSQLSLTDRERTDIAIAFLERIEDAGYYAMLYSNREWLTYRYDIKSLSPYDVWLAEWTDSPQYKGNYGIWQYGLDYVDGIGNCDCDIAYKDYSSIISSIKKRCKKTDGIVPGAEVLYKGYIHSSSWGIGKKVYVNGRFRVSEIKKGRLYGVLLGSLGWVNLKGCIPVEKV